jgi:hypothetical protein
MLTVKRRTSPVRLHGLHFTRGAAFQQGKLKITILCSTRLVWTVIGNAEYCDGF